MKRFVLVVLLVLLALITRDLLAHPPREAELACRSLVIKQVFIWYISQKEILAPAELGELLIKTHYGICIAG